MARPGNEVSKLGIEALPVEPDTPEDIAIEEKRIVPVTLQPIVVPDGGLRAWLQVFGCWLVFFNVWGFTFCFGMFQDYYQTFLPGKTSSEISWIGTLASYLLIVVGTISGPLFDLGHYKVMLFGGAVVTCFGIMMLSLSTQYYQIVLTQGICTGLGCGVLYIPGIALTSRSFSRRRAVALGLVSCGAPFGGIIYTIVFDQLIHRIGFAWTVRVMGFIMIGTYLTAFPLLLWGTGNTGDISSGTARKLFDKSAFKDVPFWLYTWANFFLFTGYLVPFFYIPSYGQYKLGMSQSLALYSIVLAQGVSIVGRLIASATALRTGVMIPWLTCGTISAILNLAWTGTHSKASFMAYAALYGGFSGALIPLPPSIFPVVCPDPKVLGTRLGMAQSIGAIASLIGSPIAGALLGDGTNYLGLQLFSGLIMLVGAAMLVALWVSLVKMRQCKVLI
ncbi:MFS transporter, MCP family, solute carrier family 16, member 10 [Exophiala viscosa]|uniref:MFS transporter, MCP family, solute carrier family 16, member 10 n=1 Tax=Exophiala viscosa TaxID=2486360 RepID=A0AAN6IE81_9EURO|nr:MFS transporter, MCP family, solute carrier family 16, member 10 [Exophiala viscosa]